MTVRPIEKFQSLIWDLFQFDCVDLDFGIYRIMNHKRAVIGRFISEDLPERLSHALERMALTNAFPERVRENDAHPNLRNLALGCRLTAGLWQYLADALRRLREVLIQLGLQQSREVT